MDKESRLLTHKEQTQILLNGTMEMLCEAQDAKSVKAVSKLFINFVNWIKRVELVSQDDWDLHCKKKWQDLKRGIDEK